MGTRRLTRLCNKLVRGDGVSTGWLMLDQLGDGFSVGDGTRDYRNFLIELNGIQIDYCFLSALGSRRELGPGFNPSDYL